MGGTNGGECTTGGIDGSFTMPGIMGTGGSAGKADATALAAGQISDGVVDGKFQWYTWLGRPLLVKSTDSCWDTMKIFV